MKYSIQVPDLIVSTSLLLYYKSRFESFPLAPEEVKMCAGGG
jgi:hypothetical protein